MGDYLNPKELRGKVQDARLFSQVRWTTQADETKGAEVIETHGTPVEDVPPPITSTDMPDTQSTSVETLNHEVTPPTEAVVTEHVATAEPVSNETSQSEAGKFDLATSASTEQVEEAIPPVINSVLLGLMLAQRPITLVLMIISSFNYSTNDLVLI